MFKQGEFFTVGNQILSDREVSKSDIAVYVALCRHKHNSTNKTFINRTQIEREARVSGRTLSSAVKRLSELGYIRVEKYRTFSGRISNAYAVLK